MGRKEKQTKPKQHLQRFMRYNIPEMISLGSRQTFYCTLSCKQFASYFKYFQMICPVQTAWESHELNMDLISFDNDFYALTSDPLLKAHMSFIWE